MRRTQHQSVKSCKRINALQVQSCRSSQLVPLVNVQPMMGWSRAGPDELELGSPRSSGWGGPPANSLPAWPPRPSLSSWKRARVSDCGASVDGVSWGPGARALPAAPGSQTFRLAWGYGKPPSACRPASGPSLLGCGPLGAVRESGRALGGAGVLCVPLVRDQTPRSVPKVKQDPRELGHWVPLPTQWA